MSWLLRSQVGTRKFFWSALTVIMEGTLMKSKGLLSIVALYVLALSLILPQVAWGWNTTGALNTGRIYHTATLLNNGKVLVVGGAGPSGPLSTAELYDPATGKWTYTGGPIWWRYGHTATLLNNGWVLVAGGIDTYGNPLNISEFYKPTSSGFTKTTGDMKVGRSGHTATLLDDGRVLLAGGTGNLNSCEVFDPGSGTWTFTGFQHSNRGSFTTTPLLNGKVLTAGGINWSIDPYYMKSCELFTPGATPATGTWVNTGDLKVARGYEFPAVRLLDGRVLATGGFDGSSSGTGWQKTAELFDPAAGSWAFTGSMKQSRIQHTATCLKNGWVLIAGGRGQMPSGPPAVLTSAALFNPSGVWADATPLTTARAFHTATLLADGKVLVAGGEAGDGVGLKSAELYVPPASVTWPSLGLLLQEDVIVPE
jgi:large repetitive protein